MTHHHSRRAFYGLFAVVLLGPVSAVPIDNGVEGDPIITCNPDSIAVEFGTRNTFEGHLFVKGRYGEEECKRSFDGSEARAALELSFDACGLRRERSANPRGVFVTVTVTLSFHPLFITKIDRALKLQCFYMEADKTVDTIIEVSMLTTQAFTQNVPMPVCRYEIRDGGPTGEVLGFAEVGQKVYHKWTCDTETQNTFCMLVHSCFVGDAAERRTQLLDTDGCAQDKFVLGNLEYPTDLMAGRDVHVYKFPDTSDVFFDCQIRISVKEPEVECADTRPECREPQRGKREVAPRPPLRAATAEEACAGATCLDVSADLQAIDRLFQDSHLSYREEREKLKKGRLGPLGVEWGAEVCFSWEHFGGFLGGLVVCCIGLTFSIIGGVLRRSKRPVVYVIESSAQFAMRRPLAIGPPSQLGPPPSQLSLPSSLPRPLVPAHAQALQPKRPLPPLPEEP